MSDKLDGIFLHKQIKQLFDEVVAMKKVSVGSKEPYIRPSSVPACAIRMFVKICDGIGNGRKWESEESLMMDYYTSVGTTTHEVFQKWFGRTGKLLGDWSCLCRGTKKITRTVGREEQEFIVPKVFSRMTTNSVCPKCGAEMKYEELEINVKGITGHIDGVMELTVGKKKYYIVIDYKGTTAEKIKNYKPNGGYIVYPDPKHTKQIRMYTYALKNYYYLNVIGHALLYTSRDTPFPKNKICAHYMTETDWKDAEELFSSQVRQVRILYKTLDDAKTSRLVKHKLCPDHKYYNKVVKSKFSECEYCSICFSAPKQMASILKDAVNKLDVE